MSLLIPIKTKYLVKLQVVKNTIKKPPVNYRIVVYKIMVKNQIILIIIVAVLASAFTRTIKTDSVYVTSNSQTPL